jgi:hypothetical protein
MTEGLGEFAHNGGDGNRDTPIPDAPERRRTKKTPASVSGDTPDENYRGQWQARNDEGQHSVTTSKQAALEFACPPDRVKQYKHGDPIDV